jgi:hypothetical protein
MIDETKHLVMGCGEGVMAAAFGAKKAALTVDRLAQNLDPRNTRGNEGPCDSLLYTDLSVAQQLQRVDCPAAGYTKEQAEEEAFAIIDAYEKSARDWEDSYTCPIMNTPFVVDDKLLWICPIPCVRKYLEEHCGYKTKWYHKLFWRGKKHFK